MTDVIVESTQTTNGQTTKEPTHKIKSLRDFIEWRIGLSDHPFEVDLDNIPPSPKTSKVLEVAGYQVPLRGQLNWFEEWLIDEIDAYFMYRALDLRLLFSALAKKARQTFKLGSIKEARDLIQTIMQDGDSPHDYANFRDENDDDFKAILEESRNLNRGMGDWFIAGIFLKIRADMKFDFPQLMWFGAEDKDAILRAIEGESRGKFKRRTNDPEPTPDEGIGAVGVQSPEPEEEDESDSPLTLSPAVSAPAETIGETSGMSLIQPATPINDLTDETSLGNPSITSPAPSLQSDEPETSTVTALPV